MESEHVVLLSGLRMWMQIVLWSIKKLLLVTFLRESMKTGQKNIKQWQMSLQDASVYKILSAGPLARLHAKLDLIWHLFSNMNVLFWCEYSLAVSWSAHAWWVMFETEEDVFIFSWLSTSTHDWNGSAIVYKFFEVILHCGATFSWLWTFRWLSYWFEAAVHTVCHVQIVKALNPNHQGFSPLCLLIYIAL